MDLRPPPTILQFLATLNSKRREDQIREFIVSYYLDDKAFSVTEKQVPNSGFRSGQFLKKSVFNNPKTGLPYEPHEVYIGAMVDLGGWQFILQEASADALKIMEAQSDIFIKCDLAELMRKIRQTLKISVPELLVQFQKKDPRKRNYVTLPDLQEVFMQNNITFGDQEFLTLFRRYQINDNEYFDYPEFIRNLV